MSCRAANTSRLIRPFVSECPVKRVSSLSLSVCALSHQANLKADSTTKTLLQRCQDLLKIIDDYPAKVPLTLPPQPCLKMFVLKEFEKRLITVKLQFFPPTVFSYNNISCQVLSENASIVWLSLTDWCVCAVKCFPRAYRLGMFGEECRWICPWHNVAGSLGCLYRAPPFMVGG